MRQMRASICLMGPLLAKRKKAQVALSKKSELVYELHGEPLAALADRSQLRQVILNLINNAFASMQDGGRLDIIIARQGAAHVRISVADTGHGIAPDDLSRIFSPFFTTKGEGEGTGLGLETVQRIIKGCGGCVTVTSKVNEGTTFEVYFPAIS